MKLGRVPSASSLDDEGWKMQKQQPPAAWHARMGMDWTWE
jgi:hypothetical protein